ncbi:MAG: hypothetical protein PVJ76_05400 [Gemmatimonadota bacterium]
MNRTFIPLPAILLLAVGLWACQDEVVTPDIEVSVETLAKKPPSPEPSGNQVTLQFGVPSPPTPGITYDFLSGEIVGKGQITDEGWVSADFAEAALTVHFQEEMENHLVGCQDTDGDGIDDECRYWCTSRSCLRGKCTPFVDGDMRALEALQTLSDSEAETGPGLRGKLEVNSADVTLNTIDYEGVGNFTVRWGRTGTDEMPVPNDDGSWDWTMEGTSLFVVQWPLSNKEPYHSTTCYIRPLLVDLVDYHFRAWQ